MVRLLVSVWDVDEALLAAAAGADFIDLKQPAEGALGALAPVRIREIVSVLRLRHPGLRISATTGDLPAAESREILRRVEQVAACGVDDVKVGIWPDAQAAALLEALRTCAASVVPVLIVDAGIDPALVNRALARRSFRAVMLDTAEKRRGSLLQRLPRATLATFVGAVRAHGALAGLAGSLRLDDAPALHALAPDFAGFRGAVSRGERTAALDGQLVRELVRRFAASPLADAQLPALG